MVSVCSTAASARPVAIQSARASPFVEKTPSSGAPSTLACPCARRRSEIERAHQRGRDPGRPVGKAEAGAGETVAGRRGQRMHPGGELLAERRVGELDVVGVDHQLGDGIAQGGVLEQAEFDAEGASLFRASASARRREPRSRRRAGAPCAASQWHRASRDRCRRRPAPGNKVMRAMTSGTGGSSVGINVPVGPKARSATTSISAAAAHDMIISRSCGSTMAARACVGDDFDVLVAQHEAPRLRVMAGRGQHRVTDEEGELLTRRTKDANLGIDAPRQF